MKSLVKDKIRHLYELLVNPLGTTVVFLMMVITVYSVIRRYFLRDPDLWAFSITYWIFGIMFLFGCGYAIYYGIHTSVDIIYNKVSRNGKLILETIITLSYLIPAILLIPHAINYAWRSTIAGERDVTIPVISPPVWWYKWILLISLILIIPAAILGYVKKFKEIRQSESLKR